MECNRFLIGLAGLPKVRDILLKSHESSLRLFEELDLRPLSKQEINGVIDLGIKEANEKNPTQTTIAPEARVALADLSEGLPHFIQQFCFSAFERDKDGVITGEDVLESAFGRGGALDLIGDRYYRDTFYNRIGKESYRQVLRIMAGSKSPWVTKDEIRKSFKGSATILDNAIHVLIIRNIIVPKEGEKGIYRLLHRGFAYWIRLYTTNPEEVKQLSLGQTNLNEPEEAASVSER